MQAFYVSGRVCSVSWLTFVGDRSNPAFSAACFVME